MKLKTMSLLALMSVIGMTSAANAGAVMDIYAGLTVGAGGATVFADGDANTDASQSFGAMAGIDIPLLRFEAEYNHMIQGDANMNIGMVNAYFKMPSTVIMPYLGVGVGTAFGGDVKDMTAAYQGMLGLTFELPVLPLKFDVEGRAMYAPNIANYNDITPDMLHYDARLKLRYVF